MRQSPSDPPGWEFAVAGSHRDDVLVLALHGELDLASAPLLALFLQAGGVRPQRVVLDLQRLEFMDVAGLRAVLDAQRDAEHEGHELFMVRGPAAVQRVFELTDHLDSVRWLDSPPE